MKRTTLYILVFTLIATSPLFSQENDSSKSSFSQPKFVPDISFIMDFSAVYRNMEDHEFESLEIPGFVHGGHDDHDHGHSHEAMHGNRGFNFNYGELTLYSVVDPYFELMGIFHLSADSFEVEEAFAATRKLPGGFKIKAGKFMSSFGRLNGQHAHYWDFADQPVVYYGLLGDHGINEKGVNISWVAPMDLYMTLGGEVLQGENETSFGAEGFEEESIGAEVEGSSKPNLYTGFIKTSFDMGNLSILLGFSGAYGGTRINHEIDDDVEGHGVDATTYILDGELTLKYMLDSYRYVSWQSEYLYRNMKGDRLGNSGGTLVVNDLEKKQSGFYTQLVVKPSLTWRIGARYEMLQMNDVTVGGSTADLDENLYKASGMIDFHPSEFSLIRIQYNYDKTKYEESEVKVNHEVILQMNIAIGAHGAHSF
jgi:hypothetical protein